MGAGLLVKLFCGLLLVLGGLQAIRMAVEMVQPLLPMVETMVGLLVFFLLLTRVWPAKRR